MFKYEEVCKTENESDLVTFIDTSAFGRWWRKYLLFAVYFYTRWILWYLCSRVYRNERKSKL